MADLTEESYKASIARFYRGNKVIGAGFLVNKGHLLTCAHVVEDALGREKASDPIGQTVKVDFPFVAKGKKCSAKVLLHRLDDEDIASLQLLDSAPDGAAPIKMTAGHVWGHLFRVYGFSRPGGVWATGKFLGETSDGRVQMEDTKAQGYAIEPGFSGAPVWSEALKAVVGMTVTREKVQEEAKVAFMLPYRSLLPTLRVMESQGLLAALKDYEDTIAAAINMAYRLSCPDGWTEETPPSLQGKLQSLQEMKPQGAEDSEALEDKAIDRFAALLITPEMGVPQGICEQIRAWLKLRVGDVQRLMDRIAPKLSEQQAVQSEEVESHLLIYVEAPTSSTTSYSVSALFIPDSSDYNPHQGKGTGSERVKAPEIEPFEGKVTKETLSELLNLCVEEIARKTPKNLTIHLILPLALINEPMDSCLLCSSQPLPVGLSPPAVRIGDRYRLVVRLSERLHPFLWNQFQELWRDKWGALKTLAPARVCSAFISGNEIKTKEELKEKLDKKKSLGLKLSKVLDEHQYADIFSTLIYAGIPTAMWLRQNTLSGVDCLCEVDKLLHCDVSKLPEAVREKRSESISKTQDAHIGHHLSFLWEDPELVPASTQASLGMP